MPYVAVHQKQLGRGIPCINGRPQGSTDCGPRSWQAAADQRTRGRIRPGVRRLRRRAGATGCVPTSLDDAKRALDGLSVPGRTPLRFYRKRTVAAIRRAARVGAVLIVAIDYGKWNQIHKRETGDPNFKGAHSIAVLDQRTRGAGIEWLVMDPLEDGRRAGIPRGSTWRLRSEVIAAAVALSGGDRDAIYAGIVAGGKRKVNGL